MPREVRQLNDRKQVLSGPSFQFSIKTLFFITLLAAGAILLLRELYLWYGPVAVAVAALTLLSIFAHVAGAALGNRLRAGESVPGSPESDDEEVQPGLIQPIDVRDSDFAPTTELSREKPLSRKPIYYACGIGAFLGASVASVILTLVMWDDLAIVNVLFGACSAAVIGGLFGLLLSSFFQVARDALNEAQKES